MTLKCVQQTGSGSPQTVLKILLDKGRSSCQRQRIACSDIDLVDLWRQAMNNRWQQLFITEYDGCASSVLITLLLLKPAVHISCLDILRMCSNKTDVLWLLEVAVDVIALRIQFVGKLL